MKFSIIIPTYNRELLLPRAITSVLNQIYNDFELIIVDDASTDNTRNLISSYDDERIRFMHLNTNSGVHIARNRGIDEAKGEILCFLDSDDELLPNALERASDIFNDHKEVGLLFAPFVINNKSQITGFDRESPGILSFEDILCEKRINREKNCFVAVRKSTIGHANFVMKNLDFIFYRRIAKKTTTFFYNKPLGIYWIDNSNDTLSNLRRIPNIKSSIARAPYLGEFVDEFKEDFENQCPLKLATYSYGASVGFLLNGSKNKARKYAKITLHSNRKIKYLLFYIFCKIPFSSSILISLFKLKLFGLKMLKSK